MCGWSLWSSKPPLLLSLRKRKKSSAMWMEFMELYREGVAYDRCNDCNVELITKSANGSQVFPFI